MLLAESQSFMVTVPGDWEVEKHAIDKKKFASVQDYIRELIRRDMEAHEAQKAEKEKK